MIKTAIEKYRTIKTLYCATEEEKQLAYYLHNLALYRTGVIMYIAPTKEEATRFFNEVVESMRFLSTTVYIFRSNLRIKVDGDNFIFKSISELKKLDGIRAKKIIFIDELEY